MKIVLKNLTKVFEGRRKKDPDVTAVNNFNFEIPDGKLVALLGPSGCGKSTTLNLISGLEEPTSGQIFFDDEDVTNVPPENRGIGLVFQNYALYPHLTVLQNIIFPLQNLKGEERLSMDEMKRKAKDVAKLVQIEDLMDRRPKELSGGQQQRVAIARALIKNPRVLLLDEPLSNLDARLRLRTREEIRRIQRETGITTVFVTHDQEEAMSIADELILMENGVINQIGAPQSVYDEPANLFVAQFLGNPKINVLRGFVQNEKLIIRDEVFMEMKNTPDKDLFVAIRPEGFVIDENGTLTCNVRNIETTGRDTSIVATHDASLEETIRVIISSDEARSIEKGPIKFSYKENKMFLFELSGERILL